MWWVRGFFSHLKKKDIVSLYFVPDELKSFAL